MRGARTGAPQDLLAVVQRKSRRPVLLEFPPPEAQELSALRLVQDAVLVQIGLLAIVTGIFKVQAGCVEAPPSLRSPAVIRKQPHNLIPVCLPCLLQLRSAAEIGAIVRG